jgi:exopolyphosphatase/guanosine-5'-triphosphate,3'-diphosphate pyrophosphatase
VAVIDVGSNSGRVMVYRQEVGGHLHVLAGSRASLRLVRDLDETGRIPAAALDRAFEALRDFRSIARGSGARRIVAAGTSALRDAANGKAFLLRVRRELGITMRTLSGLEEAHYGFLGAVGGLPVDDGALFDLGGGSLQVGRFRGRRLLGAVSVPLGALRVSDAFLGSDPPAPREIRRLREHAREVLEGAGIRELSAGEELVGTGGTLRNLARIDQRASGYPIARLHGYELTRRRLHEIVAGLSGERLRKRARVPGLNADRRDPRRRFAAGSGEARRPWRCPRSARGACAGSPSGSRRPSGRACASCRGRGSADGAGGYGASAGGSAPEGRSVRSKWARTARSRSMRSSFGRKPWSWRGWTWRW